MAPTHNKLQDLILYLFFRTICLYSLYLLHEMDGEYLLEIGNQGVWIRNNRGEMILKYLSDLVLLI